ncbi:hypothetical protein HWV62_1326 [Athelia sp. TMB]|nr:hypothetical protein HWV62_1326 [Athelia sp. TMB]
MQSATPIIHTPTFSGSGTSFYSAHNRNNTNVNGDYYEDEAAPAAIRRRSSPVERREAQQTIQDTQQISLHSIGEDLKSAHHSVRFFRDSGQWLFDEESYIQDILSKILRHFSASVADSKWIRKVGGSNISKLYPRLFIYQAARILFSGAQERQRASNLKKLYNSHIAVVKKSGDDIWGDYDIADSIGASLQKFASGPLARDDSNDFDTDSTIEKIWELDFVAFHRRSKMHKQESDDQYESMED